MRLLSIMYFFNTWKIASSFSTFLVMSASTSFLNDTNCSAIMAFKTVIGPPQLADDPTALNSNLFPVNAKGDVLFLSVLSNKISGILPIFIFNAVFSSGLIFPE